MWFGRKRSELITVGTPLILALHLRYAGESQMCVQGSVTGNVYEFSPIQRVQPVDPRDARFLLGSQLFGLSK